MKIKVLKQEFSVCKVRDFSGVFWEDEFCFVGKTDEEKSVVCCTEYVPDDTLEREDGFRGFRIEGVLDFSLIGILAGISSVLAEAEVGIFVVSTYNTDYVLVRREQFSRGLEVLGKAGYEICR